MMKTSLQITLGVQISAGLFALSRGDALAAFLASSSAISSYVAWREQQETMSAPVLNPTVVAYIDRIKKGLI